MLQSLSKVLAWGTDICLPPRCLSCHQAVASHGGICGSCWGKLTFICDPCCRVCGLPFPFEVEVESLCLECSRMLPPFQQARATFIYDSGCKDLILRFKHADATLLAPLFGHWLQKTGKPFWPKADFLIPVPLHWRRLIQRQYNQAALLAKDLSKKLNIPWLANTLKRVHPTVSQGSLTVQERWHNVQNSFKIPATQASLLKGKNVVLIDDVLTSGATIKACTQTLQRVGVQNIYILTLARVTRHL